MGNSLWKKECEDKWARVKDELKIKVNSWPSSSEKWTKIATDWINGIKIGARVTAGYLFLTLIFPVGPAGSIKPIDLFSSIPFKIRMWRLESGTTSVVHFIFRDSNSKLGQTTFYKLDVANFINYRYLIPSLAELPLNLLGDIIFHIVRAFGGVPEYLYPAVSSTYANRLSFKRQHVFPGCDFVPQNKSSSGWIEVYHPTIILGGNIFSVSTYRDRLFDNLSAHQCSRLVDCHFGNFAKSSKTMRKSNYANNFLASLSIKTHHAANGIGIEIKCLPKTIIPGIDSIQELLILSDKKMKKCPDFNISDYNYNPNGPDSSWSQITYEKELINLIDLINSIGILTARDIDDILHIVVEVHYGNEELNRRLTASSASNSQSPSCTFPTLKDHFESFDEPFFRGSLTQTTAARKLVSHTKQLELLRKDSATSTTIIPAVLVNLMESYFSPLL